VPYGQYKVCEVQQAGWEQTYPEGDGCHYISVPVVQPARVACEDSERCPQPDNGYNFGNQEVPTGIVQGFKWNDKNNNGQFNPFQEES